MDYLTGMVYDRTQADVDAGNSKGFWNISDINRVESKEKEIADYLGITITYKTWSLGDLISLEDIQAILADIQRMRNAWHTASDTPATPTPNGWDYASANNIEKILSDMYDFVLSVQSDFIYSDQIYSGQEAIL
jgi:hypothetical protein